MTRLIGRNRPLSGVVGAMVTVQEQIFVRPANIAGMFLKLLGESSLLCFYQNRDENGDVVEVSVSALRLDGHRVAVGGEDLVGAMTAAIADAKLKRCLGPCGLKLPLEMFPRCKINGDDRFSYCRFCNRKRRRKRLPPPSNDRL